MKDSQNLILAIVLSLGVLLAWQFLIERPRQLAFQEQQRQQELTQPAAPDTTHPAPMLKTPSNESESLQPSPRIRILTPKLIGSLALRGARIDDLKLAAYRETVDPKSPEVVLLAPKGTPEAYFAEFGWTADSDAKVRTPGPDDEWKQIAGSDLTSSSPVTIAYDNGEGLLYTRTISVDENYLFVITDTVKNTGAAAQTLFPWGRIARYGKPKLVGTYILFEGMLGVFDGHLEEIKYKAIDEDKRIEKTSTGGWLGITDKYWLTALLPGEDQHLTASFNHTTASGQDLYQADYLQSAQTLAPGQTITATDRLFAGAKEVSVINAYETSQHVNLFDRAIDWGWFYFLTKPIFLALSTFNGWVGNFGVAILMFTLCVKTLFFPIANRQYESMSKMKKLQPEMKKLQERFKDDKMRLQQEMMELYKREKANPLAGCLPLLLQIPIFWSLYKVLVVTIEMRHAPFFGWIKDLSGPDPSNIFTLFGVIPWDPPIYLHFGAWPLIMGATYFVLQKLSPPPPDPTQARILSVLPLIMTISLAQMSAGLLIYWSWNNLLSILQQTLIMYRMGVPIKWGGISDTENIESRRFWSQPIHFLKGCPGIDELPPPAAPEIAFSGRSNVGKSSLINALTGRHDLARTSNTPGRTQELNYFEVGTELRIVDLPGYGYAQAPEKLVRRWTKTVDLFLTGRAELKRAYLLIDARHGLKPLDTDMMTRLDQAAVSYQLVLTKTDKIGASDLDQVMTATRSIARRHAAAHPEIQATSAETGWGIEALRETIHDLISPHRIGAGGAA